MTEFSRIPSNSRSDNSVKKKINFNLCLWYCGIYLSAVYLLYNKGESKLSDHQQATMQIGEWPHFSILGSDLTLLPLERQGFVFDLLQKPKNGVFLSRGYLFR